MNIYVGNLPKTIEAETIRDLFKPYGEVTDVKLIKNPETDELRGFGFVRMPSKSDALKAIQALNGHELGDRTLIVNKARPHKDQPGAYTRGGHGLRGFNRKTW